MEELRSSLAGYCDLAYHSLLRNFGTSYSEVRRARGADTETRRKLAERLGIAQIGLDSLFIPRDQLTEQRLEAVFGLIDTTRDPLRPAVRRADLLTLRLSRLRQSWLTRDQADQTASHLTHPAIDPDLITEADLKSPVAGNGAYDLLLVRRHWINAKRDTLKQLRAGAVDQGAGFSKLSQTVLGSVSMEKLEYDYSNGIDIKPMLERLQLDLDGLFFLVKLQRCAEAGIVQESEWSECYDILVQVLKRRVFAQWIQEELDTNLILGPGFFVYKEQRPMYETWRASWQDRSRWQNKLQTRIRQQEHVLLTYQAAIKATHEGTFPFMNDRLKDIADRF